MADITAKVLDKIESSVPDHQTLIDWASDQECEAFEYWLLCDGGLQAFKEWLDTSAQEEDDLC